MDGISYKIGCRIKEIRKKTNLTQAELASLINVDLKYISRLETGSSTPSISVIAKISEVLKTDIAQFFMFNTKENREGILDSIIAKFKKANLRELMAILDVTSCITDK